MEQSETLHRLLAACGPGRLAVVGAGDGRIVRELLSAGIDARGCERDKALADAAAAATGGRVVHAAPGVLPWKRAEFDTVVVRTDLGRGTRAEAARVIEEAGRVAARQVALWHTPEGAQDEAPELSRTDWENLAFDAGLRRHPLYLLASPYEEIEFDTRYLALLEWLPAKARKAHPRASLAAARDLHMDMLREAGRRADAHAERYRLAAQFVRPGDTVLDCACGLGYGSHILFVGSGAARVTGLDEDASAIAYATDCYGVPGRVEFRAGDANNLDFLPDASVDFIASFETLEHLHEPARFLAEAKRVLRPAGRLLVSVPNLWVDEHGVDPNPHHHHVYDWARLSGEIARHFIVERAFAQTAGDGMVLSDRPRHLEEFPAGAAMHAEAEWLLALAMKDPADGAGVTYAETMFPVSSHGIPEVADFARSYANPWLVRGMVIMGSRLGRADALAQLAQRAGAAAPEASVDHGAALCVEAYAVLGDNEADAQARRAMAARARAWAARKRGSPHHLRWRISLRFVEGLLELSAGDHAAARAAFQDCMKSDVRPFSALLATKTVGAAWFAGLLAALAGDAETARSAWQQGLRTCREAFTADTRSAWGDDDAPLEFGLPEIAQIATLGSRCAFAMNALPCLALRPGWFWQQTRRDVESLRANDARTLGWLRHELVHHKLGVQWLDSQHRAWMKTAAEQEAHLAPLAAERAAEIARLSSVVDTLGTQLEATREGNRYLEAQRDAWMKSAGERDAEITRLASVVAALGRELEATREGNRYLESQRDAWAKTAQERGEAAGALEEARAEIRALEEQCETLRRTAATHADELTAELAAEHEDHVQDTAKSVTRIDSLQANVETLQARIDALERALAAFTAQRAVRIATRLGLARPPNEAS